MLDPQPGGIVVDDTSVYWVGGGDGQSIIKAPLAGGHATTLASRAEPVASIAVDDTSLYWAENPSAEIVRLTPK